MDRIILHSDCNSFYASVELLHRPELRGRAVVVGGDVEERHGIVLSGNPAARKCGIKTGEVIWQAKQKCPDLVVIPPDFDRYHRFSRMTREIYLEYTELVEPFGLDEAWLDMTAGLQPGQGVEFAHQLRERIKRELGITVSVGVSFNKIFAKLGSDYKKPDAVTEIPRDRFREIVFPLPVNDLLYVGRSTGSKLRSMGIYTIGALAQFPRELLCQRLGKMGSVLHCFANGLDTSPVARYQDTVTVKSVGNSTTAPRDLENFEDVKIIALVLADSVSRRLREQQLSGRVVSMSVRSSGLCWFSRQHKLDHHTNLASEIAAAALELFRANYDWEEPIRSLGVCVSDLVQGSQPVQYSIFDDTQRREQRRRLEEAMDGLKSRFGTYSVQPAVLLKDRHLSGFDPKESHTIHPVGFFGGH
ncbi:MAG: DNA polymerase IV [Ruminococcaceae bacterium]|nr:DNA polymerase IV [Oscillospiraceae bacterium]